MQKSQSEAQPLIPNGNTTHQVQEALTRKCVWLTALSFQEATFRNEIGTSACRGSVGEESAAMQETAGSKPWVGRSLEEGLATHLSLAAWRMPWTGRPGALPSMGLQKSETPEVTQEKH